MSNMIEIAAMAAMAAGDVVVGDLLARAAPYATTTPAQVVVTPDEPRLNDKFDCEYRVMVTTADGGLRPPGRTITIDGYQILAYLTGLNRGAESVLIWIDYPSNDRMYQVRCMPINDGAAPCMYDMHWCGPALMFETADVVQMFEDAVTDGAWSLF